MKAIVIETKQDKSYQLVWSAVPDLTPQAGDVLVDVHATAVNRADLLQARGGYAPPAGASEILGLEMAGTVAALGAGVTQWAVGDRVCALLTGGGYAEQVVVPAEMLIKLPDEKSFEWGAAIPEVWLTAFVNLVGEGRLAAGETVLLHAGASGVGTAAIQLAKTLGASVVITAGSEAKLAFCRELGADLAINRHTHNFETEIKQADKGIDLIICPVGGAYLGQNIAVLNRFGRLVHIGLLNGATAELSLGAVLRKRLTLVGSTLRSRPLAEKIALTNAFVAQFWPALTADTLKPIIDTTFALPDAQAAHDYVADNKNIGKVVLLKEG